MSAPQACEICPEIGREAAPAEFGVPIGGGWTLACGACVDAAEDVTREDCERITREPRTPDRLPVGTVVRLTGKFLRNTGQARGSEGGKRWTVVGCPCGLCARGEFVRVREGRRFRHFASGNLEVRS